ncbi:hypothetical protein [ANMV-1 virus]|nr:hypothetical protein [ANMV-1 virus]
MSTYVVDDETINKVVSYMNASANGPDANTPWDASKLAKMGFNVASSVDCPRLAHAMFDMNVAAVNARYGEEEGEDFPLHSFKFYFVPAPLIEVIKALETWLYQCLEGEMPKLRLYQAMREIHCWLCIEAVHRSDEYEAVSWG